MAIIPFAAPAEISLSWIVDPVLNIIIAGHANSPPHHLLLEHVPVPSVVISLFARYKREIAVSE